MCTKEFDRKVVRLERPSFKVSGAVVHDFFPSLLSDVENIFRRLKNVYGVKNSSNWIGVPFRAAIGLIPSCT